MALGPISHATLSNRSFQLVCDSRLDKFGHISLPTSSKYGLRIWRLRYVNIPPARPHATHAHLAPHTHTHTPSHTDCARKKKKKEEGEEEGRKQAAAGKKITKAFYEMHAFC